MSEVPVYSPATLTPIHVFLHDSSPNPKSSTLSYKPYTLNTGVLHLEIEVELHGRAGPFRGFGSFLIAGPPWKQPRGKWMVC